MVQCSFCGKNLPSGTGTMYVKKEAKVLWFCSNKCEKNMIKLRRKPRNKEWTKEAQGNKETAKQSQKAEPVKKAQKAPAKKTAKKGE